ncbi:MAG TPA: histidine kinase [Vicinamibacterales bacterium]|nr:histidine kinase [Vicinamibacterales bacterium]
MALTEYSPRARAERVIASGRACLALCALIGAWLAPTDSESFVNQATQLLAVYCLYSTVVWFAVGSGRFLSRRAVTIQYGVDLAVAIVLTMLSRGSGSPFFLFFTYMLLAAFVRWHAWGAWTTGLAVIVTYLGVVAYEVLTMPGPIDGNRFVVRLGWLAVMTMVLTQLGAYQHRLNSELHQLAAWPRRAAGTLDDVLREALGYAATLHRAPAAMLIWEQEDEDRANVALYRDQRLVRETLPDAVAELIAVPDSIRSFLFINSGPSARLIAPVDGARELDATAIRQDLVRRYAIETAIAATLPERTHRGWLVLLDRPARTLTTDDATLAEIVAADTSASVEHWYLSQRARDAAVAEERLRVSRDLHDGVLQSLTGCRLDIAATASAAEQTSAETAQALRGLERSLAHEQQELRQVIQRLRASAVPRERTALRDLCARVERQWRMSVALSPDADALIPSELSTASLLMVHEALANAARHGKATAARVTLQRHGLDLVIAVEDDGHGFAFKGRMLGAELAALNAGPRSLRERAELLGGTLLVTSTETGSTVEIRVPVTRETICA